MLIISWTFSKLIFCKLTTKIQMLNSFNRYNSTFETNEMRGFYTSSYKDEDGNDEWLVTTQFQPISARHAFPCWDEPQFKATFLVSLTYPTGLLALSNTNAENSTEIDGLVFRLTVELLLSLNLQHLHPDCV